MVSGHPLTITDTGPATCRITFWKSSKQQLDTNQKNWWNSDYLQAVPRLWNVCLPASRLMSLIASALQQNSSPLCLRRSCVHSSPSILKEPQACLNIQLSKEALTEQNPGLSSLFLSRLVLLPSESGGSTKGFWHLYCQTTARDCSIASVHTQ